MPFGPSYRFCFSSNIPGSRCQDIIRIVRDLLEKIPWKYYSSQEVPSQYDLGQTHRWRKEDWVKRIVDSSVAEGDSA